MSARSLIALAATLVWSAPLSADEPRAVTARLAAQPGDPLSTLIEELHGQDVTLEGNINEIPLYELLLRLSKVHDVTFLINEESFKAQGTQDIKTRTANLALTRVRDQSLHQFLTSVLGCMGATLRR